MLDPYATALLWIVIVAFVIAFVLAFGIGANDVANSFGTSVGSGVLSLRTACYLATVCEVSGSVLIGYKVSDTMRKGILDVTMYMDSEKELMLGCLSALASSALWLLAATFLKLPISGTHSIVGSTIGFSLVARGTKGVLWSGLGTIVGSWFVSPVLSGIMSTCLFWGIRKFILKSKTPLRAGLWALPLFYGVTVFVNVLSIVHDGPQLLHMDNIPTWLAITISLSIGVAVAIVVQLVIVPWQRRKVLEHIKSGGPVQFSIDDSNESTPNGSPKRKRPVSLIADGSALPAITEQTELASFNNLSGMSPHLLNNSKIGKNSDFSKYIGISNNNTNYKIDPKIVAKAENLLGKNSLDNTDLTVTSLNYIDDQQQLTKQNGKMLESYFDRNHVSPIASKGDQHGQKTSSNDIVIPISDTTMFSGKIQNVNDTNSNMLDKNVNASDNAANMNQLMAATLSPNSSRVPLLTPKPAGVEKVEEPEDVSALFSFLQILTATFGSFAHGGNDVSNAIGPLIAIWLIFKEGTVLQQSETPFGLLFYGGIGISVGLWLWGRRVIETVGSDLTKITPSTGFTIEIGAAFTVLLASKIGIPISTTHCKVGSVVFVGYASTPPYTQEDMDAGLPRPKAVDWNLFRNIVYAWVVTVPIAALLSGTFMFILTAIVM